jgi:hypothetical protein
MKLRVPQTQKLSEYQFLCYILVVLLVQTQCQLWGLQNSLLNTSREGLERNRSHSGSRYSTCMSGGTVEDHDNCQYGRLGGGIRNGDFGMQVGSVGACVKLLCEVKNSLLQGSVTYCGTVQG